MRVLPEISLDAVVDRVFEDKPVLVHAVHRHRTQLGVQREDGGREERVGVRCIVVATAFGRIRKPLYSTLYTVCASLSVLLKTKNTHGPEMSQMNGLAMVELRHANCICGEPY